METEPQQQGWFKSTRSSGSGACVTVRFTADGVQVRDSKEENGPVLSFTRKEWDAFLGGAVDGEFTPQG